MAGTVALVLAAGLGKRMRSAHPKVTHQVGGEPVIRLVLRALEPLDLEKVVVVVGHGADEVKGLVSGTAAAARVEFAVQEEQLGTGHAALTGVRALGDFRGNVLVMNGDMPLVTARLLDRFLFLHESRGAAATILTARMRDPSGYGRIIRNEDGKVKAVREDRDADDEERRVNEINAGVFAFRQPPLAEALAEIRPENEQGEYYLPDVIPALLGKGYAVEAVMAEDNEIVQGVNSRVQLAQCDATLRFKAARALMASGVTVLDPQNTHIGPEVRCGQDTVILPFTVLRGRVAIGRDCVIGPGSYVVDSEIGDGSKVFYSVIEESRVGRGVTVGPFSHLRPDSDVRDGARVGNYAEIKNSTIGEGTKVSHHSYIGDAALGSDVNVGAGVVFVNYDGAVKHRTDIGDGAFLGCNVNLVAPVTVEAGAYVAAGSTITDNVPSKALGIARARQSNIEGWVDRKKAGGKGAGKSALGQSGHGKS